MQDIPADAAISGATCRCDEFEVCNYLCCCYLFFRGLGKAYVRQLSIPRSFPLRHCSMKDQDAAQAEEAQQVALLFVLQHSGLTASA